MAPHELGTLLLDLHTARKLLNQQLARANGLISYY